MVSVDLVYSYFLKIYVTKLTIRSGSLLRFLNFLTLSGSLQTKSTVSPTESVNSSSVPSKISNIVHIQKIVVFYIVLAAATSKGGRTMQ